MFWPETFCQIRSASFKSGSALAYSPIPVQQGQVIEARRRVGMFWPKNLLPDPERFLVERFGFGVLAHFLV